MLGLRFYLVNHPGPNFHQIPFALLNPAQEKNEILILPGNWPQTAFFLGYLPVTIFGRVSEEKREYLALFALGKTRQEFLAGGFELGRGHFEKSLA